MKKRNKIFSIFLILVLCIFVFDIANDIIWNKIIEDYKEKNSPMITIVDDDGWYSFYKKIYPLALKHNIPITSAVIANRKHDDIKYYSEKTGREMIKNGIEIVNHGYLHSCSYRPRYMTEEDLRKDYELSKKYNREAGYKDYIHVYPFGSIGGYVPKLSVEYFDMAISTRSSLVEPKFDRYDIPRINIQLNKLTEYLDINEVHKYIDQAKKDCSWLIFMTHVDQGIEFSKDYYEDLINYAKEQGLEFVNLENGYNRYKLLEGNSYDYFKLNVIKSAKRLVHKFID